MKICTKCGRKKPEGEFYSRSGRPGKLQAWCKSCKNASDRDWYEDASGVRRLQIRDRRASKRAEIQAWLVAYFESHPCVDCGESDLVVLEFDHLDDKEQMISRLMNEGAMLARVVAEAEKCEVVCCNCHRRRTARRGGHWRIQHTPR